MSAGDLPASHTDRAPRKRLSKRWTGLRLQRWRRIRLNTTWIINCLKSAKKDLSLSLQQEWTERLFAPRTRVPCRHGRLNEMVQILLASSSRFECRAFIGLEIIAHLKMTVESLPAEYGFTRFSRNSAKAHPAGLLSSTSSLSWS